MPRLILHNQLVLTIFGRCEQYTIDQPSSRHGSRAVYSSASLDNILFDLHNFPHPTQPRSIIAQYSLNELVQREKGTGRNFCCQLKLSIRFFSVIIISTAAIDLFRTLKIRSQCHTSRSITDDQLMAPRTRLE